MFEDFNRVRAETATKVWPFKKVDATKIQFKGKRHLGQPEHLQSLFQLPCRVLSKGALPPGSLHRAALERDVPHPEPLSTISQSPR